MSSSEYLCNYFEIIEGLKLNFMKQKKELKLLVLDKRHMSCGLVVNTDKKALREACISLMDQMRLLSRSRNLPHIFGIATNLYDWQILYYSREIEL